ncbi:3-deoxy-D-manno-octulosonic acid transferase [Candidatus Pelagibacter sp.]|nr:3-deoxy-D-manno-octulosonic acid transferase [Candidatus Pelagibacter sp.]
MFLIYQILFFLIFLISPIIIFFRILNNKEHKTRFLEKFSIFSKNRKSGNLIWFHGSSVGEILSVVPLIEKYEKDRSIAQILITTSTLSSSKVISKFNFKKTIHQFYVFDLFFLSSRFINFWKPNIAIFIESEIWPSMYKQIHKKKIPLLLLNARLTKRTYTIWNKLSKFSKPIFQLITKAYPQNIETYGFLKKIGVKNIKFIGNLKFSENFSNKNDKIENKLKKKLKYKKVWVASSTHYNEEIICAKAHLKLKKKIKNLLTIIIPRHIDRVPQIISDLKKLNLKISRHTSKRKDLDKTDIYLVDTFGETKKFFKLSSSVFLGGSIIKRGGQNPLEPARYGVKIFHGPNIDNFKDVYKLLRALKISKKIKTYNSLANSIKFKKRTNKAAKIAKIGKIILKKTINELDFQIKNEIKKT